MKSTHETQAGRDENLYSREGVSSTCLFIRLFRPEGPLVRLKVRCQRRLHEIEHCGTSAREGGREAEKIGARERERRRAGSVGGCRWFLAMQNGLFLRITSVFFYNGTTHSRSSIGSKYIYIYIIYFIIIFLRSAIVEGGAPNQFSECSAMCTRTSRQDTGRSQQRTYSTH